MTGLHNPIFTNLDKAREALEAGDLDVHPQRGFGDSALNSLEPIETDVFAINPAAALRH